MADWVILVDVGTLWPESFMTDFVQRLETEPNAIAIAPSSALIRGRHISTRR